MRLREARLCSIISYIIRRSDVRISLVPVLVLFAFSVTSVGLCLQKTLLFQVYLDPSTSDNTLINRVNYIEIINVGSPIVELLMG